MTRVLSSLVLLLSVGMCACDDGGSDPMPSPEPDPQPTADDASLEPEADVPPLPDAAPPAFIEIGTGARRYARLEAGQEVPIIQGPQGGFHVWGGFRGRGFPDDDVRIRFALDLEGETIATADYTEFALPTDSTGLYSYAAVSVIYLENERVEPSSGSRMTLRATVESSDGQSLSDEIDVTPICCER